MDKAGKAIKDAMGEGKISEAIAIADANGIDAYAFGKIMADDKGLLETIKKGEEQTMKDAFADAQKQFAGLNRQLLQAKDYPEHQQKQQAINVFCKQTFGTDREDFIASYPSPLRRGQARANLLATYDDTRRPYAQTVEAHLLCGWVYDTSRSTAGMVKGNNTITGCTNPTTLKYAAFLTDKYRHQD